MRKTKIIATLGPSSSDKKTICKLINAGVNIVRINMSHVLKDLVLENLVSIIRECEHETNKRVGILIDLCGPKIRVAKDIPKIAPSYVEYFLSIKVDDEIDGLEGDVKVRGETLYQGGASDPVDPCEDV